MIGITQMTATRLDRSRSYGEIIGSTDGSKYDQDGHIFDINGELLNDEPPVNIVDDIIKRKLGRPFKNDNAGH